MWAGRLLHADAEPDAYPLIQAGVSRLGRGAIRSAESCAVPAPALTPADPRLSWVHLGVPQQSRLSTWSPRKEDVR